MIVDIGKFNVDVAREAEAEMQREVEAKALADALNSDSTGDELQFDQELQTQSMRSYQPHDPHDPHVSSAVLVVTVLLAVVALIAILWVVLP